MNGAQLITAERRRHVRVEGWTSKHDDRHRFKEMAKAAGSYLASHTHPDQHALLNARKQEKCWDWPWVSKWWKPSIDPVRNLVKAGALIAAEIDRLQRKSKKKARK